MIVIIGISRFHVRNFFSLVPMNLPAVVVTMVAVLPADLRAEIRGWKQGWGLCAWKTFQELELYLDNVIKTMVELDSICA